MTSPDDACPLDLSGWKPEDVIERWRAAFRWANGREPDQPMSYERGWFVTRIASAQFVTSRSRRDQVAAMIWRLENRPERQTYGKPGI